MLVDGSLLQAGKEFKADYCIMGGGVAGLVMATELLSSGASVIVLESGGEGYSQEAQDLYQPSQSVSLNGFPDPSYSRLRFLGGSSNHWENNTSPFSAIDFEKRSWIENSGWPISYDDLAPFFGKAGEYVGVGSDGYKTDYWAEQLNKQDVVGNSDLLQTGIAKASVPAVRFYQTHGAYVKNHESSSIVVSANVTDVNFNPESGLIEQVSFESVKGKTCFVNAKRFVMCFGGIENARMLLSFNEKYDNKIGNAYDNVGRYFMDHPLARGAFLYPTTSQSFDLYRGSMLGDKNVVGFLELSEAAQKQHELISLRMPLVPVTNYIASDGISSHHIMMDAFEEGEIPDNFGQHIVNYVKDFDMVLEAISRRAWGKKIFSHADEIGPFQLPIMIEQPPYRDNRVSLGTDRDRLGIKKLLIDWEFKQHDIERFWKALELVAFEVGQLSIGRLRLLKEREARVFGDQLSFGHHHTGTTRMSNSPKMGVVDANQKVFGTKNFFIAGSSVFPTGGHVPPTFTIVATAIRLARHLEETAT